MPLSGIPRLRGIVRQGEEFDPLVPGKPDGLNPVPSNPGLSHRPPWAGRGAGATRGKGGGTMSAFTFQLYSILGSVSSGVTVSEQHPYAVLGSVPSGAYVSDARPYAILEGDL